MLGGCYTTDLTTRNFDDARAYCASAGLKLYAPRNTWQSKVVSEWLNNAVMWTDGTDAACAGFWGYSDNTKVMSINNSLTHYHVLQVPIFYNAGINPEPNDSWKHCASVQGKWAVDQDCASLLRTVCTQECKVNCANCTAPWHSINNSLSCYQTVSTPMIYIDANAHCKSLHPTAMLLRMPNNVNVSVFNGKTLSIEQLEAK